VKCFAIRNRLTGKYMPAPPRGQCRGASHVEPDSLTPRVFWNRAHARNAITMWAKGKHFSPGRDAADKTVRIEPQSHRDAASLEIVTFDLVETWADAAATAPKPERTARPRKLAALILEYVEKYSHVTATEMAELHGHHRAYVRAALCDLHKRGLIGRFRRDDGVLAYTMKKQRRDSTIRDGVRPARVG
jgi:hypothetical protein